jgi:adenosine deaminase
MDCISRAHRAVSLLQTVDALRLAIADVFRQLLSDNVIYAELRFAPLLHLQRGLKAAQVVETVERATEECIRETGVDARLILCTLRHFSREQSLQTVQLVEQFRGSHVAALDIAGDEAGYPLDAHIPAFQFAIDHGIHRTAHAGEAAGAGSVWDTLRHLQPTRIGHGVRSAEDPQLVARLKSDGIHLEVCPTSNVQTNAFATYDDHPVNSLLREGVSLSINTDCRTIMDITLNREFELLQRKFGWTDREFSRCNQAALQAAFIDDREKQQLLKKLAAIFPHAGPR